MTPFQTQVVDLIMSGLAQVPPAKHADWLKQMMTSSAAGGGGVGPPQPTFIHNKTKNLVNDRECRSASPVAKSVSNGRWNTTSHLRGCA